MSWFCCLLSIGQPQVGYAPHQYGGAPPQQQGYPPQQQGYPPQQQGFPQKQEHYGAIPQAGGFGGQPPPAVPQPGKLCNKHLPCLGMYENNYY